MPDGDRGRKVISGRELISHIREAYAFQDKLFLLTSGGRIPCEIISFRDPDTRNVSLDRELEILLPFFDGDHRPALGDPVFLEILSKKLRLSLTCALLYINGSSVVLRLPSEGILVDVRKKSRFSLSDLGWHDVLIYSKAASAPCMMKVLDINAGGAGAHVVSQVRLEDIGSNLWIETKVSTEAFVLNGPYRIIRFSPFKHSETTHEYTIAFSSEVNSKLKSHCQRPRRHVADASLRLNISATNVDIEIELADISLSGFKGRVKHYRASPLTTGIVAREALSGLRFRVARLQPDGAIGFELISLKIEERIRWLNMILPILSKGRVDVSATDARSILNLFFEAGTSIAEDLDYKRHQLTEENALKLLTVRSDILMRWVNVSETGRLLGHHSTFRIGINSWYTGDLVGGQTASNKADRGFFKSNFQFLRELLERFETEQKIVGSWKLDHPVWQDWRNDLLHGQKAYAMERCDSVGRNHIEALVRVKDEDVTFSTLSARDLYSLVGSLSEGKQHLLAALDIFSTGDGSNGIQELYLSKGKPGLKRKLYGLCFNGRRFLVLLSHLPSGIALNPTFDSAFIFPIVDQELDRDQVKQLYANVLCFGSRNGFRISWLRYFSEKIEPLGTLNEFFVTNSKGLEVFE